MLEPKKLDGTSPIFVVGYMHSGTTMLRKILGMSPIIFSMPSETVFFDYLPIIRRKYPNLQEDSALREYLFHLTRVILDGVPIENYKVFREIDVSEVDFRLTDEQLDLIQAKAKFGGDHVQLFRLVLDNLTEMIGKIRWLEKTPSHIFHIDKIIQSIPDAQIVEITRDPRDILTSKMTRNTKEWLNQIRPERRAVRDLQRGFDPFRDTIGWKSAIRAGDSAKNNYPDSMFRVRYEDLVTDPEYEILRICEFLNLAFCPEMLQVSWGNTIDSSKKNAKGIGPDAINRWQRSLDPESVAMCQWVAKKEMDKLGYTRVPVTLMANAKIPGLLGRSIGELMERLYRRWRWGGFVHFRTLAWNYWHRLLKLAGL